MLSLLVMATLAIDQADPQQAYSAVQDRLQRLDRLVIELTHRMYWAPEKAPLDRSQWVHLPEDYPYRVTIVRPNCLVEFLLDKPEVGYAPLRMSVWNSDWVSHSLRPNPKRPHLTPYGIAYDQLACGPLGWQPLLQVLDIQFQDCTVPRLHIAKLLRDYDVQVTAVSDAITRYAATAALRGCTADYEFDLDSRGTPRRILTTLRLEDPSKKPITWEQRTLGTREVNGAELVVEAVVLVRNPNVMPDYNVHHYVVTSVHPDESLRPEDVRITPETRNASIREYFLDNTSRVRFYDESGQITYEDTSHGQVEPLPADDATTIVSRSSLGWRIVIPPTAAAVGLAFALWLLSRRRTVTPPV